MSGNVISSDNAHRAPEGEGLPEVSELASGREVSPEDDRLTEIARMANLLAYRVLNAQVTGRPVTETDIHVLLEASILLNDYGLETPPQLSEIVRRINDGKTPDAQDEAE